MVMDQKWLQFNHLEKSGGVVKKGILGKQRFIHVATVVVHNVGPMRQ